MRRHDWYVPWLWHQCPAWEAWLVFVLMIVIFAAVLVAVVYLARVASPTGSDTASAASTESPRDTLERHYEAGEIDREEYQSHRRGRVRVSRPQCGYCQPGLRAAPTTQRSPMNILYTATAHVTGNGRNGHAHSDDGLLDLELRVPTSMGDPGGATNPEQLFAAGSAACFHSALTSPWLPARSSTPRAARGLGCRGHRQAR
jgi:uncharacterized membrane protein